MVISPLVLLAVLHLEGRRLRRAGVVGCAIGLVGLAALLGWAVISWEARYGAMTSQAVGLRFLYLLATETALPVVQCGLAGLVLWSASRLERIRQSRLPRVEGGDRR